MIGSVDPNLREAHVIGAGIAGLLVADHLDKSGYSVHLYEAASRAGGLLGTIRTEFGISETAAHSVLATENVKRVFSESGVRLVPLNQGSRARYVYRGLRLRKFPLSIFEAIGLFFRAYFVLSKGAEPLNLAQWTEKFLGKSALRYLIQPFVRGIYGTQPEEIIVEAAFPGLVIPKGHSFFSFQLRKFLRKKAKPRSEMMAPENGMGDWVERLSEKLKTKLGPRYHLNHSVNTIEGLKHANVIITVPADKASALVKDTQLAAALNQIQYTPLVSVTAFVDRSDFFEEPQGVGVLIPREAMKRALGILFNSSSFSNRVASSNISSFTVIFGGTLDSEILESDDREIEKITKEELSSILKLKKSPRKVVIHRQPRAVPKYDACILNAWKIAREGFCSKKGRVLFGNYTGQVSLRGMIESLQTLPSCRLPSAIAEKPS